MRRGEARKIELEEKMEKVVKYFLETGASSRQIAVYFTEHYFPVSHKTVNKYIHTYMKDSLGLKEELEQKIEKNREKSIYDEVIQKQILIELGLLFKGYKIEEIAQILDKGFSSVQRDLTTRLEKLCKIEPDYIPFYEKAKEQLQINQTSTIDENRKIWK